MLTETQKRVFNYLHEFKGLFDYMPTTRDIQQKFSFKSQTGAVNHLKALVSKGYIIRPSRKARAIVLLKPVEE